MSAVHTGLEELIHLKPTHVGSELALSLPHKDYSQSASLRWAYVIDMTLELYRGHCKPCTFNIP